MGSYISGSQIRRVGPRLKKKIDQAVDLGGGEETDAPNYITPAKKKNPNQ